MAKSFESLDLSTRVGQHEFEGYSPKEKEAIVEAARAEAGQLTTLIKFGVAKNYQEAYQKLLEVKHEPGTFSVIIDDDSNIYLDMGSGRTLIGNPLEGAWTIEENEKESTGILDKDKYEKNMKQILEMIDQLRAPIAKA